MIAKPEEGRIGRPRDNRDQHQDIAASQIEVEHDVQVGARDDNHHANRRQQHSGQHAGRRPHAERNAIEQQHERGDRRLKQ